jgi:hypothetical protein|tara:strand:+ start:236 stop:610 length:375 start_codon:yes stop_codon:yes gene_type:complete
MESLIILYGLFVKHAIADLAMQSFRKTPGDKANLRSPKGYIHAGDHAVLTFIVIALLTNHVVMSIVIALLDYVLHFIIDHFKTKLIQKYKWTNTDNKYWIAQTTDQILHYTCYLFYILLLTSTQ